MAALACLALLAFGVLYGIDHFVTGGSSGDGQHGPLSRFFFFDPDHVTDAVVGLGGMVAAVLGIVITVVSIVVQLSAERYTGVTTMFFRDRTNVLIMAFYVVTCVLGVGVSLSLRDDYVPRLTLTVMMGMTILGLVMMAPYFSYVFRFLEPANIVGRIQRDAVNTARSGAVRDGDGCTEAQAQLLASMEELTDITSNSISGKDKIIASRAVDALKDLALDYAEIKPEAKGKWFDIGVDIQANPDFVAMDPESLADLVERRTWVEWKIMRQYLGIYNEAQASMRDISYLIAIDTRYIGEAAAKHGDDELVALVFRYMNSYLRSTLNAKDVRTAYNVLNQYRKTVEAMLRLDCADAALTAVGYMKYYAHVSFDMKLPFVTETVAYDVGAICQLAHELGHEGESEFLRAFLELDRPSPERVQEQALKGVRKAQVKLAAYYLEAGEEQKAKLIYQDMAAEPQERLRAIRSELARVETKDFWEIIDRGRNFEFMPAAQKAKLDQFFDWFDDMGPASDRRPHDAGFLTTGPMERVSAEGVTARGSGSPPSGSPATDRSAGSQGES